MKAEPRSARTPDLEAYAGRWFRTGPAGHWSLRALLRPSRGWTGFTCAPGRSFSFRAERSPAAHFARNPFSAGRGLAGPGPAHPLFLIDFLQLLPSTSRRAENRRQESADSSNGIMPLAKEPGVPVLVLSQLNRELERDKKPPALAPGLAGIGRD